MHGPSLREAHQKSKSLQKVIKTVEQNYISIIIEI